MSLSDEKSTAPELSSHAALEIIRERIQAEEDRANRYREALVTLLVNGRRDGAGLASWAAQFCDDVLADKPVSEAVAKAHETVNAARAEGRQPTPSGAADAVEAGPEWAYIPPGKRFGRYLTEDAVGYIKPGTLLLFDSEDPWFEPHRGGPQLEEVVVFTGRVSNAFPKVGPHLEVRKLSGDVYAGGAYNFRMFRFVSDVEAAALATPAVVGEPAAWTYELATNKSVDGVYGRWEYRLTKYKPAVPEGSIRNLTPLYSSPPAPSAEISCTCGKQEHQTHHPDCPSAEGDQP